jgi:hypothetical protein
MKERELKLYHTLGFGILTILLIMITIFSVITYTNRDLYNSSAFFRLAINYHTEIMIGMMIVSVAFGFFWSKIAFSEFKKQKDSSKDIIGIIMLFLHSEEKEIISCLMRNGGKSTQAEISKLPGLNRVKAYRALQKMEEKRIIEIVSYGKIRKVILKENIMNSIFEN